MAEKMAEKWLNLFSAKNISNEKKIPSPMEPARRVTSTPHLLAESDTVFNNS